MSYFGRYEVRRVEEKGVWDEGRVAFVSLDLVAAGARWGTKQYNNRAADLGPVPMGVAFTLAGAALRERTPPHTIYRQDSFRQDSFGGASPPTVR